MLFALVVACGSGAAAGDDDDDANPDAGAPDATPMCSALAAPRALPPGALPQPLTTARGRDIGAGPVAFPAPRSAPLPPDAIAPIGRGARTPTAARATRVGLRIAILTAADDTPSYLAARAALERIGVPYDVILATDGLSLDKLYGDDESCRYNGIILATSSLSYQIPGTDDWESALSPIEWDTLDAYEADCGAREVAWYAYPNADNGLVAGESFDSSDDVAAVLADGGRARFPYLNGDLSVAIEHVWGYRASVVDPAFTTPLLTTDTGDVLAAIHERAGGTEVLAMTLDSGTFSVHAQLLEYGAVQWLTRGVFLGKRRTYMIPQIDDVFLDTELWPEAEGNDYRASGSDVQWLASWQAGVAGSLPPGSTFVTHLGFNGSGTVPSEYPDTSLVTALRDIEQQFVWVNHTWSHTNMNAMSAADAKREMSTNCDLAALWDLTHFSCDEAITPQVSGLDNPSAIDGILAAGVHYVVSDTSVNTELRPDNPGTNPLPNVGRPNPYNAALYQVPRHPTNIYYSTSLPDEQTGLYNEIYREFWGRDLSYDEIIDADSDFGLTYLLTYDIDPLMFHQANLRTWVDAGGAVHTLYTDWVDRVIERYAELVELPILTPSMTEVAAQMQAWGDYRACDPVAYVEGDTVTLMSARACTVPITGIAVPDAGRVETYAGEPTTHVELTGCEPVTIPLPEPKTE
jgi:hypothetical protein